MKEHKKIDVLSKIEAYKDKLKADKTLKADVKALRDKKA
jgi:hypothetical protein